MKAAGFMLLFRRSATLMLARIIGSVLTLAAQVALARALGAEQLGVYVIGFSLAGVLSILCASGYPSIAARYTAEYRRDERPDILAGFIRAARLHIGVISTVLLAISACILFAVQRDMSDDMRMALLIGVAAAPAFALVRFHGAFANGVRRYYVSYLPDLVARPALFLALLIAIVQLTDSASGTLLLAVHIVLCALLAIVQWILLRPVQTYGRRPAAFEWRRWTASSSPLILVVIFGSFFGDLDILMLGLVLPAGDVAVFSVCLRITMLIAFGIQLVHQIVLPDLAEAHAGNDRASLERAILNANRLNFWAALAALLGLWAFGPILLSLFGEEFRIGQQALVLLAAAQVIRAAAGPSTQLMIVGGEELRTLMVFGVSTLVLGALNLALVPVWGLEGAAWAVVLTTLLWTFWLGGLCRARLDYRCWVLPPLPLRHSARGWRQDA